MNKDLEFDPKKKILKVKSLNDYILHMDYSLSRFAYINECLFRNKTPEYIIMDNPLIDNKEPDKLSNLKKNETISINMKDNKSSKTNLEKFVAISSSISKEKINFNIKPKNLNKNTKSNTNDDLVLFIDSIEEDLKKYNSDEIVETQKKNRIKRKRIF